MMEYGAAAGLGSGLGAGVARLSTTTQPNNLPRLSAEAMKQLASITDRMTKAAVEKQKAGDEGGAAKVYRQLAEYREQVLGKTDKVAGDAYAKSGAISMKLGLFDQAESALKGAFAVCQRSNGPGAPQAVPILKQLGDSLTAQKKSDEAQDYFEQALKIEERVSGEGSPSACKARLDLANSMVQSRDFKEAEPLLKQSIDFMSSQEKADNGTLAGAMGQYAEVLKHNNKASQAEEVSHQLEAMKQKNGSSSEKKD